MFLVFPRFRMRISVFALPTLLLMLWLDGNTAFLILLFSAAAHELGHIAAMRMRGHRPRRIDVLPMGALIVCPEGMSDADESLTALSGPLVSLFCGLTASVWFAFSGSADALYTAVINSVLGVFNLMPIKKLDGGKALCCSLAARNIKKETAEHICSAASVISKCLFVGIALICISASDFNFGVILLFSALIFQIITD